MIKRWLWAITAMLCLLGAGCARTRYEPPAALQLQADICGRYGGMDIRATLSRSGQGTLSLLMQSPASLKGMRFTCRADGTVLLQYHDLQYPARQLPERSLARVLCTVLDDVARRSDTLSAGTVGGKAGDAAYLLRYAPDGTLLSLSMPTLPLEITFE